MMIIRKPITLGSVIDRPDAITAKVDQHLGYDMGWGRPPGPAGGSQMTVIAPVGVPFPFQLGAFEPDAVLNPHFLPQARRTGMGPGGRGEFYLPEAAGLGSYSQANSDGSITTYNDDGSVTTVDTSGKSTTLAPPSSGVPSWVWIVGVLAIIALIYYASKRK